MIPPSIPDVIWCNSRTLYERRDEIEAHPHVVHDAMPDGVYAAPDENTLDQIVNSIQCDAVGQWIVKSKA